MDSEEREIFHFLKTWGAEFVGAKEISRRASTKKKYHEDPNWALPVLGRMEERGVVESNAQRQFRIKPVVKKGKDKRWVAPDIAKILSEGGVPVEGADEPASDDYYEEL